MNATVHQLRPETPADSESIEDIPLDVSGLAGVIAVAVTADPNIKDDLTAGYVAAWETLTRRTGQAALAYAEKIAAQRQEVVAFATPLPANTGNPCDRGI